MMDDLLREIVAAYGDGFRPIRRFFCLHENGVTWACPLVVLAVRRGIVDKTDPAIEIDGGANAALDWAASKWGEDFVIGFIDGFDGQERARDDGTYVDGHTLGVEAARRLKPRDPDV